MCHLPKLYSYSSFTSQNSDSNISMEIFSKQLTLSSMSFAVINLESSIIFLGPQEMSAQCLCRKMEYHFEWKASVHDFSWKYIIVSSSAIALLCDTDQFFPPALLRSALSSDTMIRITKSFSVSVQNRTSKHSLSQSTSISRYSLLVSILKRVKSKKNFIFFQQYHLDIVSSFLIIWPVTIFSNYWRDCYQNVSLMNILIFKSFQSLCLW